MRQDKPANYLWPIELVADLKKVSLNKKKFIRN